jgi:hypothetical protein
VGVTGVDQLPADALAHFAGVASELADFRACVEDRIRVVHADLQQLRRITHELDRGVRMSARIVLNFEHGLTASAVERRPQGGTFLSLWQPGGVLIVKLSEASLHALWLELSKAVGMLAPASGAAGDGPAAKGDAEAGDPCPTRWGVAATTPEELGTATSDGTPATEREAAERDAGALAPGAVPADGEATGADRMSLDASRRVGGFTSRARLPRRAAGAPGRR